MKTLIINNEECKPIPGFNRYAASKSGTIYRIKPNNEKERDLLKNNPSLKYFLKCQIYEDHSKKCPSMRVGIANDEGKWKCKTVTSIIIETWGEDPPNKHKIIYKDGNFRNVSFDNLKYVPNAHSKLTIKDVEQIRGLIEKKIPLRHIAEVYGVTEMTIQRIKTGENWNNGKLIIKPPKAPFKIQDGRIRRIIATFDHVKTNKDAKRPFNLKRDPNNPENNIISGTINGYRLSYKHKNVSRARLLINKLNRYFFNEPIAERVNKFIIQKLDQKNIKPLNELYQK